MHLNFARFSPVFLAAATLLGTCISLSAQELSLPDSPKADSAPAAESGVPVSELSPQAPDTYTVKKGDTLWAISGLFLKSPWRWPALWNMNKEEVRNPHLIYPGQQLILDRSNGRATLRTGRGPGDGADAAGGTVRLSPRTRSSSLASSAIPTLSSQAIEPFLAEPLIVDANEFAMAPRIVATQEGRVLLSRGDRAYASGEYAGHSGKPLKDEQGEPFKFRVFRSAKALKDPTTQAILGYEAQSLGQAELVRGESTMEVQDRDGKVKTERVPATIDIVGTKEEMRVGDRLVPEPPRELRSYVPHAPASPVTGQIVSIYGNAVAMAGENQIVVINRGAKDGIERGHVMAILKDGQLLADRTDSARPQLKLPNERNGLMMVFRTFESLSYALILRVTDGVKVGDRFANPN